MNKKILNTDPKTYNNIKFKSTLEVSCYKKLEQTDFEFSYEGEKCEVFPDTRLISCIGYAPKKIQGDRYEKSLSLITRKIQKVTYTPDFVVRKGNIVAYFDVKGYPNDTYAIKKKMFLGNLERRNDGNRYMFFEPHSVKQMVDAIELIKKYHEEIKRDSLECE